MTSFISWVGVDSRGPASVYLASDSRITWDSQTKWDCGRKLFASAQYPELLGYVGDVLFPSQILGQIVDLIDSHVMFREDESCEGKWRRIADVVKGAFIGYPRDKGGTFTIVYATRQESLMSSQFHVAAMSWNPTSGWDERWIDLPTSSGLVAVLGSGVNPIKKWSSRWDCTNARGTSRSVYGAFCDSLFSGDDPRTGGPPQLVGIYRKGSARTIGVVYKEERYIFGLPANSFGSPGEIEWRNSLFERCDGVTGRRLSAAQAQPAPQGLGRETQP